MNEMSCKTGINFLQGMNSGYSPSYSWIYYEERNKIIKFKKKVKCNELCCNNSIGERYG